MPTSQPELTKLTSAGIVYADVLQTEGLSLVSICPANNVKRIQLLYCDLRDQFALMGEFFTKQFDLRD